MAYSQVGIVNLALGRIGMKVISSMTESTPQAEAANRIWDYIRDEVLEAKNWRFAKTRDKLARAPVSPIYTYDYAYVVPNDFLRLAKSKDPINDPVIYPISILDYKFESLQLPEGLEKVTNGGFAADTDWTKGTGWTISGGVASKVAGAVNTLSQAYGDMVSAAIVGESYQLSFDLVSNTGGAIMPQAGSAYGSPVYDARVHTQIIVAESATAGIVFTPMDPDVVCSIDDVSLFKVGDKLCLITDYEDDEDEPLYLTYIKKVTDVTKYPPSFVNALAWRLADELAINLPESRTKMIDCNARYRDALVDAVGVNQALDYDEESSDDWEMAGR